jgi:hypothetical protein
LCSSNRIAASVVQRTHVPVARDLGQDRGGHDRTGRGVAADPRLGRARQAARQAVAVDARDVRACATA